MKKKRKISIPVIDLSPNVVIAIVGGIVGLVLLLCIPGSEEEFEPAYAESKPVTDTWNENAPYDLLEEEKVPLASGEIVLIQEENTGEPGDGWKPEKKEKDQNIGDAYYTEDESGADSDEVRDESAVEPLVTGEQEELELPETVADADMENVRSITEKNVAKEELEDTKPEDKPKTSDSVQDKDKKPEYNEAELVVEDTEKSTSKMVYDSVFGWINQAKSNFSPNELLFI